MGYILNFYKFPIKDIGKFSDIDEADFEKMSENEQLPENIYERVLSNFTNWIYFDEFNDFDKKLIWTDLFKNLKFSKYNYKIINKSQFKNIIFMVCHQVRKNFKSLVIDTKDLNIFNDFKEKPIDLTNLEGKYPACIGDETGNLNLIEKIYLNIFEINKRNFLFENLYTDDSLNKLLDKKWEVNQIDSFDYILLNLIYIYKIFDWDHYTLLAINN
ncbi:MAG: hypothetical protein [Wendovervirus sonii]|uniref:Uncharacterized protein n=1 Tax=phage Lak_Megaphage_Sonny TaxID=3109229 RepID=A0ABZ0Z2S0_9CAUD|nr:MAG: hypothetical protein [phage Lak_Megaphage_Sonny]